MIRDVVTRWNSFWEAMDRFLDLREALEYFWLRYCKEFKLTETEWTLLKELHEVLGPLYAATLELSSEDMNGTSRMVLNPTSLEVMSTCGPGEAPGSLNYQHG